MNKYQAILTEAGLNKLAAASLTGEPVNFVEMAVGDGGGQVPTPDPEQKSLVNEVYRAPLNRVVIADQAQNVIRTELIILPQIGGFWMREAALYDDYGECLAVASLPPSYKPEIAEGSGRSSSVNVWIAVSNAESVQLTADLSAIVATMGEVEKAKSEAKDYTDEVAGTLDTDIQQAITDAIAAARRDFWEEENPRGTVRFFAQNVDPNEKWPWSEWIYTGENKTIRVGKADGSDVGQTGGSDNVSLQRGNLPAVQIDVSGETSEKEEQQLQTEDGGAHDHDGVPSRDDPWEIGGDIRQLFNPAHTGKTDQAPNHKHNFVIPAHKHNVSGKTDNLGAGESFSVVEAHTLLMCWARVA